MEKLALTGQVRGSPFPKWKGTLISK